MPRAIDRSIPDPNGTTPGGSKGGRAGSGGTVRRPTLADVAKACGLSKASVSIALNQPPEKCALKAETRQHILSVAQQMGYRPHWLARSLGTRRTQSVAVLYSFRIPLTNGIYEQLVSEFNASLSQGGFQVTYLRLSEDNDDWRHQFEDGRYDGALLIGHCEPSILEIVQNLPVPVVAINVKPELTLPQILFDDAAGMRQAMDHLLSLGHERISYFRGGRPSEHYSVEVRAKAYREAMSGAGLERYIDEASGSVSEYATRFDRLADAPTAVITYAHEEPVSLLRRLRQRGLRLPEDVSLISFNDVYPLHEMFPAITCVRLPSDLAGVLAARTLLSIVTSSEKMLPLSEPLEADEKLAKVSMHFGEDLKASAAEIRPIGSSSAMLSESLVIRESTAPPPKDRGSSQR